MSIDYYLINWHQKTAPPRSDEGQFLTEPLGTFASVKNAISQCYPETTWHETGWGSLEQDDDIIEFDTPARRAVVAVMVHAHSEDALEVLKNLCNQHRWSVFDVQTGRLITFDSDQSASSDDLGPLP